jgi:hypothetical protein
VETFLIALKDEMSTRTLDFKTEAPKPSAPASVIWQGPYSPEFAEGYSSAIPMPVASIHKRTWSLGGLGYWLLALTTITTPIVYSDPQRDLLRSGSSIVWSARKRAGRRISMREAYTLAMRILTDTDKRLMTERINEARFTLGPWEEQ